MENQDFTTTIVVDATPEQVIAAVNNVRGWWSENIEGATNVVDTEFSYHYEDVHQCRIKVVELIPNEKVVWLVLDNYFKFTQDENEWKGNRIIFEISENDSKTKLKFTQQGLVPANECFQICQDAWTHYIQGSLKDLILTGQGSPTPKPVEDKSTENPSGMNSNSKSIYHRLLIETPAEKIFEALTTQEGLAGWWTPDTIAKPELGSISRFTFEDGYFKEMEIIELKPYSKVKWRCIKGYEDWLGTEISFELEPHRLGAVLLFHHDGWKEYSNGFASCSYDWALFLRSLRLLCETAKGQPYPNFND